MTVTLPFLSDRFNRFNAAIFGGKLPPVALRISTASTRAGCYSHRLVRRTLSVDHRRSITISRAFDLPQDTLEDIIIHEMIHYWIDLYGPSGQTPHGQAFRTMMEHINRTHSRHISITITAKSHTRRPFHIVCVATLSDGRTGMTVAARSRIFRLYSQIPRMFNATQCSWYMSRNAFFDRFPAALKPKLYLPDPDELRNALRDSSPLSINTGKSTITVINPSSKRHT